MRNVLAEVTKETVAGTIDDLRAARPRRGWRPRRPDRQHPARRVPAVAATGRQAKEVTTFADVPHAHCRKIRSPDPSERLNRDVKWRTDVVEIFPDPDALLAGVGLHPDRGPRRVARQRPPLPLRVVHGPAHSTAARPLPTPLLIPTSGSPLLHGHPTATPRTHHGHHRADGAVTELPGG
jgi:hypothetical protein